MATTRSCIRTAPRPARSATIAGPPGSPVNGARGQPGTTTGGHVRRTILRTAVAVVTAGLTLPACGGSDGGGSSGGSGKDAATATSAGDVGGMDALVKAAKAEGTLNVIALPRDWANYGAMLDAFGKKYGIKINNANPLGSSQDELNAVTSQKGQDRGPDVLDLGTNFAQQAGAQDLL